MQKREIKKAFVTGADGFIGSHLVESLLANDVQVTALCVYNSQGSYGWLDKYCEKTPHGLNLVLGDIRDAHHMSSLIKGHDTVFHLASLIAIPYSYKAPTSYFETNAVGTLNICQASIDANVARLVHTSTSEVYGTARFVPITEEHPKQAQSPYSASKISADTVVESFVKSFDLPATILRPFNTYGPRQSFRAVIPTVLGQIIAGKETITIGDTSPTRDFNYVSDTAAAFIAVGEAEDDAAIGVTFNAGSGREISVGDMAELAAKSLGRKIRFEVDQARIRPANSEVERLLADSSKLTRATGWKPTIALEEGLLLTAEWLRASGIVSRAQRYYT